jgi:8-oxo-dGTP diphosphatase
VQAAGGIVLRRSPTGELAVLLVHRPRYDDWTFPKGKVDEGETAEQAARREVREETGLDCAVGRRVGSVRYRDGSGRPKVVIYWEMTAHGGSFEPNDEVDRIEWLSVDAAVDRLTYENDRELLRRLEP